MIKKLIRKALGIDVIEDLLDVGRRQREVIRSQQAEILRLKLEYTRTFRDQVEAFLIVLDNPELEEKVRPRLVDGLADLTDEVARLEEHVA